LNALAKRDVAIVSEEAGTTRDAIEVHLDLGGVPVILIDTAGLREAEGRVEAEGIRRAWARAGDADLVLWLVDASAPQWDAPSGLTPDKSGQIRAKAALIRVLNKIDLAAAAGAGRDCIGISAKTGEGLGTLVEILAEKAALAADAGAGGALLTRTRHRIELEAAETALARSAAPSLSHELKAEELRIAARHLGRLTGRVDAEEILGAIFAEFCIGK
jgi:tRNA modification GTPase